LEPPTYRGVQVFDFENLPATVTGADGKQYPAPAVAAVQGRWFVLRSLARKRAEHLAEQKRAGRLVLNGWPQATHVPW
jgi:hypothetical protein